MDAVKKLTREQVEIELAAHGHAVIEVRRDKAFGLSMSTVLQSPTYRRNPMHVSGPAAGHERLKTKADPTGKLVLGTLNNCAGGFTPWGTVLTAEEISIRVLAANSPTPRSPSANSLTMRGWGSKEKPTTPGRGISSVLISAKNRWSPIALAGLSNTIRTTKSTPVKRTALGRCKHEGATVTLSHDNRVVVYTGDDSKGEYLYRFVSDKPYQTR